MIEMRTKDGTTFDPNDATWSIVVPSNPAVPYTWEDVALIMLIEPTYDVVQGQFGPPGAKGGMPIRGVKFTDMSDLAVEVPMPLQVAREMGSLLAESAIEVVSGIPTSLLLADKVARASKRMPPRR
jgi:hypothetical protein